MVSHTTVYPDERPGPQRNRRSVTPRISYDTEGVRNAESIGRVEVGGGGEGQEEGVEEQVKAISK